MAWSKTAPTLPSGSSWSSAQTTEEYEANWWKIQASASIARLSGNNVAVKCVISVETGVYGAYYSPGNFYLKEGSTSASEDIAFPSTAPSTVTVYWTGEKAPSASVVITVGTSGVTASQRSVTLTAPALLTYTITYNGNGNTGGSTASQTKSSGVSISLRQNGFTRTGYTFQRWNTKADGSGTNYAAGATYSANASVTLYAIWAINTYNIYYGGNGGTGSVSPQTKTYGVSITLRNNAYTRQGYTFQRWNTKADGSGTNYAAGATYSANASVTLYAQWSINTYSVTYNGNGNTGGSTAAQTKTYGSALTLRNNGFIRTGYTFLYWNTKADGSGTTYQAGASYTANAAVTLYAIWRKANIPVYVNVNGTIHQVEKVYANVNGAIKECTVYINSGGTIYNLV